MNLRKVDLQIAALRVARCVDSQIPALLAECATQHLYW